MFREMRRRKQALSLESCVEVLRKGTSGVLAVSGDDGYPLCRTLSYVYDDGRLFSTAPPPGTSLDAIAGNAKGVLLRD